LIFACEADEVVSAIDEGREITAEVSDLGYRGQDFHLKPV